MRDQFTPDIADVVVDSEDVFLRIRDFAEKLMPHMADRIKQHAMTTPLFHHFGIEKEVEALYQPKVDLPNGASIVIDQAEALVAIDVNSGKYKAGGDSDETAYRTNLDAIPEIVRQLRLRDLGGLIIIDFIDMAHEKQRRNWSRSKPGRVVARRSGAHQGGPHLAVRHARDHAPARRSGSEAHGVHAVPALQGCGLVAHGAVEGAVGAARVAGAGEPEGVLGAAGVRRTGGHRLPG